MQADRQRVNKVAFDFIIIVPQHLVVIQIGDSSSAIVIGLLGARLIRHSQIIGNNV